LDRTAAQPTAVKSLTARGTVDEEAGRSDRHELAAAEPVELVVIKRLISWKPSVVSLATSRRTEAAAVVTVRTAIGVVATTGEAGRGTRRLVRGAEQVARDGLLQQRRL